ncbi:hypothetical protein [Actinoplanes awajinensis]|nr:hypothetical protein [Actinoplanes awajinensis]
MTSTVTAVPIWRCTAPETGSGNLKSVATGNQIVGLHPYGGDPSDTPVIH